MHSRSLRKPEERAKSTETGVTGDCGSLCGSGNQICDLCKSSQSSRPLTAELPFQSVRSALVRLSQLSCLGNPAFILVLSFQMSPFYFYAWF